MPRLEFSHRHIYSGHEQGISLPIILRSGDERADLVAKIDTGATNCLFDRQQGEALDLDIENGHRKVFGTATGWVEAFGHIVQIEFVGMHVESMVYFFADERIRKNLLGRTGWLDRVRFGLVDHDQSLYLAPYDYQSE